MKKLVTGLAILGVIVLVWYTKREKPVPISFHVIDRGPVELTVSNTRAGTIKACRRSRLSMQVGGRVAALHVAKGAQVEAGQLLLELWNEDRKAMLVQATSQASAAINRREQLCVEADNAAREGRRATTMNQRKLASLEATELAQTRARASAFSCQAARDEEATAASNLHLNQVLLDETLLRAPFAGIVAEINGEVGELVTPSPPGIQMPPAVDLIDYSCLYVTAPIDEVDAGRLHTGLPARISLDAFRGEHFEGTLNRIAPYVLEVEKQARTVEVDVLFKDADARSRLLVGYSADIDIILDARNDVVRVPTEAVMDGDTVYRLNKTGDRIARVAIKPGIRNWNFTEVSAGLAADDRVITSLDQEGLGDGVAVIIADD